jgi:hypothetical protein
MESAIQITKPKTPTTVVLGNSATSFPVTLGNVEIFHSAISPGIRLQFVGGDLLGGRILNL